MVVIIVHSIGMQPDGFLLSYILFLVDGSALRYLITKPLNGAMIETNCNKAGG